MEAAPLTDLTNGTVMIGDTPVRRMGFGAMRLCGPGVWGPPTDPAAATAVLRHAVDRGVNFIDTAEAYGPHENELSIATALRPYPDDLLIATKGGLARSGPGEWGPAGRPDQLRSGCEGSLARLQLDTIDLYQLHSPDPEVPLEEQVGVLAELQREGKIRHIGLSNVDPGQLELAQAEATIASVQNKYNVVERDHEDVLTACERTRAAFIAYFPLAPSEGFESIQGPMDEVAQANNASHRAIALAWLLARSPQMLVIPGTSKQAHLDENIDAAFLNLEEHDLDRLSAFTPGMGGFLSQISNTNLSDEGKERLQESTGRLQQVWNKLKFWD